MNKKLFFSILFAVPALLLPAQKQPKMITGCYYVVEKSDSALLLKGRRDTVYVSKSPIITVNDFQKMKIIRQTYGGTAIEVVLSKAGAEQFKAATEKWIDKRIAIVVDGEVMSAPIVRSSIPNGKFQVTGGDGTRDEMEELIKKLRLEMKK